MAIKAKASVTYLYIPFPNTESINKIRIHAVLTALLDSAPTLRARDGRDFHAANKNIT